MENLKKDYNLQFANPDYEVNKEDLKSDGYNDKLIRFDDTNVLKAEYNV